MLKSKTIVPIHVVDSLSPDTIVISEELMKQQGIPRAQHISLQFGVAKQSVHVLPDHKKQGLSMHSRLAQLLSIPQINKELKLALSYQEQQTTLKLGPLIAVMINKETTDNLEQPFGNISAFCLELVEACVKNGAFVYFFTPQAITTYGTVMSGWTFDEEWRKLILPLPEVIYNRLPNRKAEGQLQVQKLINETSRYYNISIFNERFLDKHEVFDILADHEAVKQYLPESELLTSYEQLEKFINEHRVAYVKPIQGSLGRGIIRITAQPNSTYSLERAVTTTQKASNFTSLKRLYLALKPQLAKRKYQIQQGLSLIQHGRRPVDFRALVQKNGQGHWSITSVVARTAGNDNFVANLARGGSIDSVLNTLPHTNLDKHISYDTIKHSLKAIALTIANALDERVDGHFAEFGVDLAVDVQGDIWLIEVNSKPSKVNRSSLSKKIRPSVRMLVAYANHLSGFRERRHSHGKVKSRRNRRKD